MAKLVCARSSSACLCKLIRNYQNPSAKPTATRTENAASIARPRCCNRAVRTFAAAISARRCFSLASTASLSSRSAISRSVQAARYACPSATARVQSTRREEIACASKSRDPRCARKSPFRSRSALFQSLAVESTPSSKSSASRSSCSSSDSIGHCRSNASCATSRVESAASVVLAVCATLLTTRRRRSVSARASASGSEGGRIFDLTGGANTQIFTLALNFR